MKKILFTLALLVSFGSFGQNKSTEDLIQSIVDIGNKSEEYKKQLEMLADTYNGDIRQMSKEYLDAFQKYEDELKKKSNKFNSKRLQELQELELVIKNYELAIQKDLYNKAIIFMDDITAKLKLLGAFQDNTSDELISSASQSYLASSNSQYHNGLELNGPKDFVKTTDFTWEKGSESVTVKPMKFIFSKEEKETLLKQEARGLTFLFSQTVDYDSGPIKIAVFKTTTIDNKTVFVGKCLEDREGYTYLIMPSSTCVGDVTYTPTGSDRTLGQASITQLFYITGYMAERIRTY